MTASHQNAKRNLLNDAEKGRAGVPVFDSRLLLGTRCDARLVVVGRHGFLFGCVLLNSRVTISRVEEKPLRNLTNLTSPLTWPQGILTLPPRLNLCLPIASSCFPQRGCHPTLWSTIIYLSHKIDTLPLHIVKVLTSLVPNAPTQ